MEMAKAAYGALLGALVGDAAGAVLEFHGRPVTPADVDRALSMPGGGVWRVAPGQVTDDGELTLCQARALAASPRFDLDRIAAEYVRWVESEPFDIGNTTASAMGGLHEPSRADVLVREGVAAAMAAAARQFCLESKANGALMRAVPLGVWGHGLPAAELAEFARRESRLTHPNPACADAVACYVLAVAHLVERPGDRAGALAAVTAWSAAQACAEVQGWLALAWRGEGVPYTPQTGFVRIAFVHAFRHLCLGSGYVAALRETLAGGGDTDTNACIVGGLVGACEGSDAIPTTLRDAVLASDHRCSRHPRPEFLHPHDLPQLAEALVAARTGA